MWPGGGYSFRSIYGLRVAPSIAGLMNTTISFWQATSFGLALSTVAGAAAAQNLAIQPGDVISDGEPVSVGRRIDQLAESILRIQRLYATPGES